MTCHNCNPNINKTFILEPLTTTSACTGTYTNQVISCSGNTSILLGTNIISFNAPISTNNSVSATTYYGDGSQLSGISTDNFYTTGSTLIGNTVYFNRTDILSAYTLNLSGISTDDFYTTGVTLNNTTLSFNRNDILSAYTVDLSIFALLDDLKWENAIDTFNDWFLPSFNELEVMKENLYLEGVGNFIVNGFYWSSSEYDRDEAYRVQMTSSLYIIRTLKSNSQNIRPCRLFTALAGAYSLRDIGPAGGLIFNIRSGFGGIKIYYEAAPTDITASTWSNISTTLIGTTSQLIGAGLSNSQKIISQSGHINSAALSCLDYSLSLESQTYIRPKDNKNIRVPIVSATTYYGDGSQLSGISSDNFYTTGATLDNSTIYFDRTDTLSAYTVDLSAIIANYTRKSDYVSSALTAYQGYALLGSSESSNVWSITKIITNISGSIVSSSLFNDVAWSDRYII